MTKTENYNLNQWAAEDPIRRTDFNEDNEKIDAALHELEQGKAQAADLLALQTVVSGKAQAADLTALQKTVAGKADASALAALQTTVAGKAAASTVTALQAAVAAKGDCLIAAGSYVGTGETWGTVVITTPFSPKLVVVVDGASGAFAVLAAGSSVALCTSSVSRTMKLTWQEKGVSWTKGSSDYSAGNYLNSADVTYYYIAFA